MSALSLKELLISVPECKVYGNDEIKVSHISVNSREIGEGSMFIAIRGNSVDGNKFIQDAISRGAKAVLSEDESVVVPKDVVRVIVKDARTAEGIVAANFYGHPSRETVLIGITGTNGKTTTSYLLESIFNSSGMKTGVIGTINIRYRGKTFETANTTPDSLTLQKILREMVDAGVGAAIMEVSSHALSQQRVSGCDFSAGIFTNLSQDHLDYHEDMDSYFKAKEELFSRYLNDGEKKDNSFAIINMDDEKGAMLKSISKVKTLTYGLTEKADFYAADIDMGISGTRFKLHSPSGETVISTTLIGIHNVYNILASVSASWALGISSENIRKGVEAIKNIPGRFQNIALGQSFLVIVDYAHTHDALTNLLRAVKSLKPKRVITVFGAGGDRDRGKRPKMARAVTGMSNIAIITSDNPRTENPEMILADIETGFNECFQKISPETAFSEWEKVYTIIGDRRSAIRKAIFSGEEGDAIVIAGKGHENYQIIGNDTIHFSDAEEAMKALNELGYR